MLNHTTEQDHHLDLYGVDQLSKQINRSMANGDPTAKLKMCSSQLRTPMQAPKNHGLTVFLHCWIGEKVDLLFATSLDSFLNRNDIILFIPDLI